MRGEINRGGQLLRCWKIGRTLGLIAATLLVLSALPAGASASTGSWLAGSSLDSSGVDCTSAGGKTSSVAFDGSGNAYAVWVRDEGGAAGNSYNPTDFDITFSKRAPGGSWSTPQVVAQIPTSFCGFSGSVRIAVDSSGDAVIAWTVFDSGNGTYDLHVATRPASADAWTVPASPVATSLDGPFDLGIDSSGNATLAFTSAETVEALRGNTDGTWDASPAVLGTTYGRWFSLSVDSAGDALIAFQAGTEQVDAVSRGSGDTAWGSPQALISLGPSDNCQNTGLDIEDPQAAISNSGRAVVTWQNYCDATEPKYSFIPADQASVRDGGSWSAPSTLIVADTGGGGGTVTLSPVMDAAGDATALLFDGDNDSLDSYDLPAGSSTWGAQETVLSGPSSTGNLVTSMDPGGDAAVAFEATGSNEYLADRPSGGAWSTSSVPAPSGFSNHEGQPAVGVSPTGGALAIWAQPNGQELGGSGGPWDFEEQVSAFDPGPSLPNVNIPNGYTGQTLTFSADASSDWSTVDPSQIKWDFGDGNTDSGSSVTHAFDTAGPYTVTVTATDAAGNSVTKTQDISISDDGDPPDITINSPANDQQIPQGSVVDVDYSCSDTASGVATCAGPLADGAQLDTSQVGDFSFEVDATDNVGNSSTKTVDYSVVAAPPTAQTGDASGISQTGATVSGTVDPNGQEITSCKFEYGTDTSYTATPVDCSPDPGSGTDPVTVSADLSGLSADTTYHYQLVVVSGGQQITGGDQMLHTQNAGSTATAPSVITGQPTSVTQTTATLHASVNPHGSQVTSCTFQLGKTKAYSMPAKICSPSPGSGSSQVGVTANLTGLSPGTTYHYRITAANTGGLSTGSDVMFTTKSSTPTKKINTTSTDKMPDVVKLQLDNARSKVLNAGINADFRIVQSHASPPKGVLPGDVFDQSPNPGTSLTSGVGQHPTVTLKVYDGPKGQCPEQAIANGIDGLQLDAALKVLQAENCKVDYDLHVSNKVSAPTLASAKPGNQKHSVLISVLVSDDPTKNDLHVPVFPVYSRVAMTFTENTWQLTAGQANNFMIHVLTPMTWKNNAGADLEGAKVFVDNSTVGGTASVNNIADNGAWSPSEDTDKNGNAEITLTPDHGCRANSINSSCLVPIVVMWTGANGLSVYGVAEVPVVDRSGDKVGTELPLEDGAVWAKGKTGWHLTFATDDLAQAAKQHVLIGELQTSNKPIGKPSGDAQPSSGRVLTDRNFGAAPASPHDLLALPQGARIITAGGGNAGDALSSHAASEGTDAQTASNPFASVFANLSSFFPNLNLFDSLKAIGSLITAGGGNIITAGGGNLITAGGGNLQIAMASGLVTAGGGNLITAGGGNLITPGGGNIISAGGGNLITAGGGN
jgi:hypothetical protein